MEFDNKIVVVTGATGALGRVVATAFLSHGARVAAVARDSLKLAQLQKFVSSGRLDLFSADVTDESAVQRLFADIQRQLGGADILVHTAGGFQGGKKVQDISVDEWNAMMDLNLMSTFLCCKYALSHMAQKGGGKIIAISALAALEPKANRAAYLVSKTGVLALIRAIAEEGKSINVQANALAPGIILTEANKRDMPDLDQTAWVKPEDMAETILHLCASHSHSITGAIIKML